MLRYEELKLKHWVIQSQNSPKWLLKTDKQVRCDTAQMPSVITNIFRRFRFLCSNIFVVFFQSEWKTVTNIKKIAQDLSLRILQTQTHFGHSDMQQSGEGLLLWRYK